MCLYIYYLVFFFFFFFFHIFSFFFFFFFFQAEDGIRDVAVTGVQTCALPILSPWTFRNRLVSSIASGIDPASRIAKPPITSLVSANGPSTVDSCPFFSRTRTPSAVGRRPAVRISTPSRVISSISLPMSFMSCSLGTWPLFSSTRIIDRNRMCHLLARRSTAQIGRASCRES